MGRSIYLSLALLLSQPSGSLFSTGAHLHIPGPSLHACFQGTVGHAWHGTRTARHGTARYGTAQHRVGVLGETEGTLLPELIGMVTDRAPAQHQVGIYMR